jgi:hypothetical protein
MFFSYRKSPLGVAVREYMVSIVGFYKNREEAERDIDMFKDKLSAELKIVDIGYVEGWEKIAKLDPDSINFAKECGYRYVLLALWTSSEP